MLSHLPQQQFADVSSWRAAVCEYFVPLNIRQHLSAPFENRATSAAVGDMGVTLLETSAQTCVRTTAMADRADQLLYKISLQRRGHSEIVQDGQRVLLAPGQWSLYNTTRPYEISVEQGAQLIIVVLPASTLGAWAECLQMGVGHALDALQGSPHIAFASLQMALREQAHLSQGSQHTIADSVVSLLAQGIGEHLRTATHTAALPMPTEWHVRLAQLARIQQHIASHLHLADLSVTTLAAHFHISRRYLYQLFALQKQTPADYIQHTRLERCKQILADQDNHQHISQIAWQHGFADAAAFSHAFKHRFGLSPTAWRQQQTR